jgi:mono/diheme cytochrome c family protein
VLPVLVFIGFWVLVAAGVFFLGIRQGPSAAPGRWRRPTGAARGVAGIAFVVMYIGFGVGIPIAFLTGNHANANSQIGGIKLTAAEKTGRELFGQHCGVCHTLAGANAVGKVGPNLDSIRPSEQLVLHTITNGCLQSPPSPSDPETCLGEGTMPPDILQGKDAQNVAAFVSKVAGQE